MKTAFIVLKSPHEQDPSHMIEAFARREEASIILFEDGVFQALTRESASRISSRASDILVCDEDLEARGFSPSDLRVGRAVGYPEIVDCIMERSDRTITV